MNIDFYFKMYNALKDYLKANSAFKSNVVVQTTQNSRTYPNIVVKEVDNINRNVTYGSQKSDTRHFFEIEINAKSKKGQSAIEVAYTLTC